MLEAKQSKADAVQFPKPRGVEPPHPEPNEVLIENKYMAAAAVVGFLVMLWFTGGSLYAAFGALALIAGIGWIVRWIFR